MIYCIIILSEIYFTMINNFVAVAEIHSDYDYE